MRRSCASLLILAVAIVCAGCVSLFGLDGLNPEQRGYLRRAASLESIEAFQRDVEPAIIRARNSLMTRENYRSYSRNDYIYDHPIGDQTLYSLMSRTYEFDEHDPVRVRAAFAAELEPLGFECREDTLNDDDGTTDFFFFWTNVRYGAGVSVMVSENWLTSISYSTDYLRSDGTSANPKKLADLPGRVPEWFDEVAAGTQS